MPPKQTGFSPGNDLEQQLIDLLTRITAEGRSTESQVEQINLLTTMTTPTHHASLHTVYETDEPPQQEEADADSTPTPLPLTNSDALQETADASLARSMTQVSAGDGDLKAAIERQVIVFKLNNCEP